MDLDNTTIRDIPTLSLVKFYFALLRTQAELAGVEKMARQRRSSNVSNESFSERNDQA